MKEQYFATRQRMKSIKAALRRSDALKDSGSDYDALVCFIDDIAGALADQRPKERQAAFHYVIRTMGVIVKRHAEAAYKPYGYKYPFVPSQPAPQPQAASETPKVPLWKYPVINMPPSRGTGPFPPIWHEYSALKMFGYTVGKTNGWRRSERQAFLTDFMEMDLPSIVAATFEDEYGEPCTTNRLRKVANVIATNASNFYRKDANKYETAIGHWEEDLLYLRDRYYDGLELKFMPWPTVRPH